MMVGEVYSEFMYVLELCVCLYAVVCVFVLFSCVYMHAYSLYVLYTSIIRTVIYNYCVCECV